MMCFVILVKQVNPERFEKRERIRRKWQGRLNPVISKFSANRELPSYTQSTNRSDSMLPLKYKYPRKHIASQVVEKVARVEQGI
jgi:hypothetical protein